MIDLDKIIERIKSTTNLKYNKEVAETLGLSPADFSLRKKRGTILTIIIQWAINQNVNLDWLITGKETHKNINKHSDIIPYDDAVEAEHHKLIGRFKNKEKAKILNAKLVELEDLNEILFDNVDTYLQTAIDTANKLKESDQKKTNDPMEWSGTDRRKNKAS